MELTLRREADKQIRVICNGELSHIFDLHSLLFKIEEEAPIKSINARTYGKKLYQALFPPDSPARHALNRKPKRLLLVTVDNDLDAIPWEYAYGVYGSRASENFLVLECLFVRGIPAEQRISLPPPKSDLRIIAIPSNPLVPPSKSFDEEPVMLNIEGEWERLKEIILQEPYTVTLERTRPPTLYQLRRLVASGDNLIVHFMGHGTQIGGNAALCFEQDDGSIDTVTAQDFAHCVHNRAFLAVLNTCVSASPGPTNFSNLAAALVWQEKIPYALGMRSSILDDPARRFSRTLYSELASGSLIEEALLQARRALSRNTEEFCFIGVPVLYTALHTPTIGFTLTKGIPKVIDSRPPLEVTTLTRAEGTFYGRSEALITIGQNLTGDERARLMTIHGIGGQGKTVLAREAVERFAYAWPGGVWAIKLDPLPNREEFVNNLACFLQIIPNKFTDADKIERQVLYRLQQSRTLIVLDNAETLDDAVKGNDPSAIHLAQFIRLQLPQSVTLLATSRSYLGWPGEIPLELKGLLPEEGAALFLQTPIDRLNKVKKDVRSNALTLSNKLAGNPLCLRLLAGLLDPHHSNISDIIKEYELMLQKFEDRYEMLDSPHRTLFACLGASIQHLDTQLCALLSLLRIFSAPFSSEIAADIFDTEHTQIPQQLQKLWQGSLLEYEKLYNMHPAIRLYVEQYMAKDYPINDSLRRQFGMAHAQLAKQISAELDSNAAMVSYARDAEENFKKGIMWVDEEAKALYLLHWGWIEATLGSLNKGIELTRQLIHTTLPHNLALEKQAICNLAIMLQHSGHPKDAIALLEQSSQAMMRDPSYKAAVLCNKAESFHDMGQLQQAKDLYEEALPILRGRGNRGGEAKVLNNLAGVYQHSGQFEQAKEFYQKALQIRRQIRDRRGESRTLNNIALLEQEIGQLQNSLDNFNKVLPIRQEMGELAGEATTRVNIAGVYEELGSDSEALNHLLQALTIREKRGDVYGQADIHNAIGIIHSREGLPDDALEEYEKALSILRKTHDRAGEVQTLNRIIAEYRRIGDHERAQEYQKQAREVQ